MSFGSSPGALEAHSGALDVNSGALEAHFGTLGAHPGASEANSDNREAYPGAPVNHLQLLRGYIFSSHSSRVSPMTLG